MPSIDADPHKLEGLLLNATRPVSEMGYDGWLIRVSRDDAKRASSVVALGPSKLPLDLKISRCENVYAGRGLQPVFRLTSMTEPGVDEALASRGYVRFEPSLVQAVEIAVVASEAPSGLRSEWLPPPEWWEVCGRLHGRSEEETFVRQTRLHLTRLPVLGLVAYEGGEAVACGQAVIDGEYAGLFEIYTSESQRGRGIGYGMTARLLHQARDQHKAIKAWLSVLADNVPALAVYARLGFETVYDYWYRVRPTSL